VQNIVGGSSTYGKIAGTDRAHATFTAPSSQPTPNPVKVSVKVLNNQTVEPIQLYILGHIYHVKAAYQAFNTGVCPIANCASLIDTFELDLDLDSRALSNITSATATAATPFTCTVVPGATVSSTVVPDRFTPTGVDDVGNYPPVYDVTLKGTQKLGSCACIADGATIPGDGGAATPCCSASPSAIPRSAKARRWRQA